MKTIVSIQYLRAMAVLLVVILHNTTALQAHAPEISIFEKGNFGVDLFFVISGFIMWLIAATRPTHGLAFFKDRVARIWPLYAVMTIVTAFVTTEGGLSFNFAVDWGRLIGSLLFIPQWHDSYPMTAPILFVGWTLNLEMAFYLLFAGLLFVAPRQRLFVLCALLFSFACARIFIGVPENPALYLYTYSLIAEFALGAILGALYLGYLKQRFKLSYPIYWGVGLVCVGVALFTVSEHLTEARLLHYGTPALLIVAGFLISETWFSKCRWRPLEFLGDASYSIYLTHIMALSVSNKILGAPFGENHTIVVLAGQTIFAFLVGSGVHIIVEKPLSKALKHIRRMQNKTTIVAA